MKTYDNRVALLSSIEGENGIENYAKNSAKYGGGTPPIYRTNAGPKGPPNGPAVTPQGAPRAPRGPQNALGKPVSRI